jgi:thiol-disulfide isomerase/thioredoxin
LAAFTLLLQHMTSRNHLPFYLVVLLLCYESAYSQNSQPVIQNKDDKVALADGQFDSLFSGRYIQLNKFTYNDLPQSLRGSVDSLNTLDSLSSDEFYYSYFTSAGQRTYLQFLKKRIDTIAFVKLIRQFNIDTSKLSKKRINDFIYFFTGVKKNGDILVFMDANNNGSFSDDPVILIKRDDSLASGVPYNRRVSNVEQFYDGKTYKIGVDISIKFKKFHESSMTAADSIGIVYRINNHKAGSIDVAGHKIPILIKPGLVSPVSYDGFSDVEFKVPNSTPKTFYNHIGDTIYFEGYKIALLSISKTGDSLEYKVIGNVDDRSYGANLDNYAYDFKLEGLNDDSLEFYKVLNKGKYVLLDFWGTWCHPCLEAIPQLKEFYTKSPKMDSLAVIGICVDDLSKKGEVVRKARSLGLPWVNLLVDRAFSFSDPSSVVNLFKVTAYPTYILLAPDGKILSRGSGEDDLTRMLNAFQSRN